MVLSRVLQSRALHLKFPMYIQTHIDYIDLDKYSLPGDGVTVELPIYPRFYKLRKCFATI